MRAGTKGGQCRVGVWVLTTLVWAWCCVEQTETFGLGKTTDSINNNANHANNPVNANNHDDERNTFTLLLVRHGNSVWNGGQQDGTQETFTGWTDVPLSDKGVEEAKAMGTQVASLYPPKRGIIDACFTSVLGRATMTAHYCLWGFAEQDWRTEPRQYVSDYRLNERHYGALQGLVKHHVEHNHNKAHYPDLDFECDPAQVQAWRRSWYAVPPLLDHQDPRRIEELRKFQHMCNGPHNVPRGESLDMVAQDRIRPFLEQVLHPILSSSSSSSSSSSRGGTGLVVAHANSLRALIGVICNVCDKDANPTALQKLEAMKLQTGVPLVLQFQSADGKTFQPIDFGVTNANVPPSDLPVWPLHCLPLLQPQPNQNETISTPTPISSTITTTTTTMMTRNQNVQNKNDTEGNINQTGPERVKTRQTSY